MIGLFVISSLPIPEHVAAEVRLVDDAAGPVRLGSEVGPADRHRMRRSERLLRASGPDFCHLGLLRG